MDSKFWDTQHSNTSDVYWLTGSPPKIMQSYHNLSIKNYKDKKILEIGVGTANFLNYLKNNITKKLYAADISQIALSKVSSFAVTALTDNIKNLDPVDLAICHLVFQHCNNIEIERIINDVQLTKNGIFSFQYAFLRENTKAKFRDKNVILNKTHFFRSPEEIRNIISNSNKCIINESKIYSFSDFNWEVIKVKNK